MPILIKTKKLYFLTLPLLFEVTHSLIFRSEQFEEMTQMCKTSDRQPLTFILNDEEPAKYLSLDPTFPLKSFKKMRRVDQTKFFTNLAESRLFHDIATEMKRPWPNGIPTNGSIDCVLQIQTQLPKGDKSGERYDALSLVIIELDFTGHISSEAGTVEISTFGHEGHKVYRVTKNAHYSDRIWAATNPNFLLSGQLSGFDSIDYRTKVDTQHIIKPDHLHSTFDKPASITVNITRFRRTSNIYMVFTSYRHLRHGERCQELKEFDCSPPSFLSSSNSHLCMSSSLACDGLPNCGQDFLPNQDENCFKIHWSSVLLSLVSYILLAITLLLCLSCFARVLIQWSVRSSLAELRGMNSPTGSFRSSSRFFSFLGNTFTSRWERPPPTYDEAMKHINPDINRPSEPPAYSDTCSLSGNASESREENAQQQQPHRIINLPCSRASNSATATAAAFSLANVGSRGYAANVNTPPPEYDGPFLDLSGTAPAPQEHPAVVILPPTPSSSFIHDNLLSFQQQETDAIGVGKEAAGRGGDGGGVKVVFHTTVEAEICPGN